MAEKKSEKLEREYIIPLREKVRVVPRYRKTSKAVRTVKEFLARHMKIRDRDLDKIKLDKYLNEALWHRGIKNPPHKIKVKAVREGDIVRAELAEYPENLKFKKLREEKINKTAREAVQKKKTLMEKAKEAMKPGEKKPSSEVETESTKEEAKEKEQASAEATKMLEQETAKKAKHETKISKEPKHQRRMALQK